MDVKGFLIDLDGVMYVGNSAVDGARRAIDHIRRRGYRFRFVSNTTRKSRNTIAGNLEKMGIPVDESSIFTPPVAALAYMKNSKKCRCMLVTTADVRRDFEPFCEIGGTTERVDYVVVGDAGDAMTYDTLNRAFRCIRDGADILALEKDRYWMAPDGLMLSAGPFVAALEYASGKDAVVLGKPSLGFFSMALRDMGLPAGQVAMIGDDITTDIAGARNAGMQAILVRTGKFSEADLGDRGSKPDAVIDSIACIRDIA